MYYDCDYRVSYGDTDQMGVVYYANYLELFERGRTEMLRSVGLTYREMEEMGILLPVTEAFCKYRMPARYDDLLTIRSCVEEIGRVRLKIASEVLRDGELLVSGYVVLGCVNREHRPVRMPEELTERCRRLLIGNADENHR